MLLEKMHWKQRLAVGAVSLVPIGLAWDLSKHSDDLLRVVATGAVAVYCVADIGASQDLKKRSLRENVGQAVFLCAWWGIVYSSYLGLSPDAQALGTLKFCTATAFTLAVSVVRGREVVDSTEKGTKSEVVEEKLVEEKATAIAPNARTEEKIATRRKKAQRSSSLRSAFSVDAETSTESETENRDEKQTEEES